MMQVIHTCLLVGYSDIHSRIKKKFDAPYLNYHLNVQLLTKIQLHRLVPNTYCADFVLDVIQWNPLVYVNIHSPG